MKRERSTGPERANEANAAHLTMESGIVRIMSGPRRPTWDEVDDYLLAGKHRALVEGYAAADPDFAEVLRWMRNDVEPDSCPTPGPRACVVLPFPGAPPRDADSTIPPPL